MLHESTEQNDSLDADLNILPGSENCASVPTAQSNYQTTKYGKITQGSIDKDTIPDTKTSKRMKSNNSQNLYQSIQGLPNSQQAKTAKSSAKTSIVHPANTKTSKRVQSGASSKNHQNYQNNIRRLNSPQNNIMQTNMT